MVLLVWCQSVHLAEEDIFSLVEVRVGQCYGEAVVTLGHIYETVWEAVTWNGKV